MEFYLAIRRNEVLIHITTQMNLEIRMRMLMCLIGHPQAPSEVTCGPRSALAVSCPVSPVDFGLEQLFLISS